MHYRNGRIASNGDKIIELDFSGKITAVGVLYNATAGNCNGAIAPIQQAVTGACLIDCLHVEDVEKMIAEKQLDKRPEGK
jgi:hypothetical protein